MANLPSTVDATLAKLMDAIIASMRNANGDAPAAAPNSFVSRSDGTAYALTTKECALEFRINPDGQTAWARVTPIGDAASSISGRIDIPTLATKLV